MQHMRADDRAGARRVGEERHAKGREIGDRDHERGGPGGHGVERETARRREPRDRVRHEREEGAEAHEPPSGGVRDHRCHEQHDGRPAQRRAVQAAIAFRGRCRY